MFTISASLSCLQGAWVKTLTLQALSFRFIACSFRLMLLPGQCAAEKLKDLCVAADNHNHCSLTAAVGEDEEVQEL